MGENINSNIRDVNAKRIFENSELCAQFLRDYVDIPYFKNITAGDIEDVTARFMTYFGVEYDADVIKKVNIKINDKSEPVFVVPLIDHKSNVDYNVSIQLLKYMICIWAEWDKQNLTEGNPRNKEYKYPPIIPIVYYEGSSKWTADLHLRDRIAHSELFSDYIPDFKYSVICTHDYTNEELLTKRDEMSLLMIINKIQKPEDISEYLKLPHEQINDIIKDSPTELVDILAAVVRSLCKRIQAPQEEVESCVRKVVNRNMGFLFENMEKMDIQAERRNTREQRERAEAAESRLEAAENRAEVAERVSLILKRKLSGMSNSDIAREFNITEKQVEEYLK